MYHPGAVIEDDEESSAGDKYVVCANCGARIKATRERCLRCFEPLRVDRAALPFWRSLHISDQIGAVAGAIAVLAVGGLVYVLWTTADKTVVDSTAKPAERRSPLVTPPTPQGATPGTAQPPAADVVPSPDVPAISPADDLTSLRESFEEKLKRDPNDSVALIGLGLTLERLGNQTEALATFKRASEVAPGNATARKNLAKLEAQLGQWDKAILEYRIAARLTPNDSGAHYNLALALQETHDDQGAVPEFEAAIQLAPGDGAAHRGLAVSLERLGHTADAAREYERYLSIAPDAPDSKVIRDRIQRLPKS